MPRTPSMSPDAVEKRAEMSARKPPPTVTNLKKRPVSAEKTNSNKQKYQIAATRRFGQR
jgi:hypothetical protein